MFGWLKKISRSTDGKPVFVQSILLRDECSRLIGDFAEKGLPACVKLVIVWEDQSGDRHVASSDSLPSTETSGLLLSAALEVGANGGK